MKKIALSIALGASLLSTAAMAGEQRPTYLAFSAPAATTASSLVSAPAPSVAKRDKGFGTIPLFVPLVGAFVILGIVAAVATGDNNSNGSPG